MYMCFSLKQQQQQKRKNEVLDKSQPCVHSYHVLKILAIPAQDQLSCKKVLLYINKECTYFLESRPRFQHKLAPATDYDALLEPQAKKRGGSSDKH